MHTMEVQREFLPGSSWLYYRIFTSPRIADTLLLNFLWPLANKLKLEEKIYAWFFIRYSEEGYHIRFRFNVKEGHLNEVIDAMYNIFKNENITHLVSKISIDIYSRELERYGKQTIEIVEKIFHEQSKLCVLYYLKETGEKRFQIALRHTHEMLSLFYSHFDDYRDFIISKKNMFKSEFNPSVIELKTINKSYTSEFPKILLGFESPDFININTTAIPSLIKQILMKTEVNDLNKIVSGIIHMHINRIFSVNQRGAEFLIYDYLVKLTRQKK